MKSIFVIGGSGALGKSFISHFSSLNYITVNVDLVPNPQANENYGPDVAESRIKDSKADLIVNAAGGWAGGDASDPDFKIKCKKMWEMNVESAILAASLASKYLKEGGLLVFVGAKAVAMHPTPDMLAYAMAKSAVDSLAMNMEVLDTEANRKCMPDADISKWTPVNLIVEKVAEFIELSREEINGKSWLITTRSGITNFTEKQTKK